MTIKHIEEFRDPEISKQLIRRIARNSRKKIRLMEVCGTHTMAISKNGIRSVLPESITLLSGPGCPVCVTAQSEIDAFIDIAQKKDVVIATFGDLIRVPGSRSSLQKIKAEGGDIRIVYSTSDAVDIARKNPEKHIVFPGVGFETTAPTVAAAILTAAAMNLDNFYVYSAHKLVPPALFALMANNQARVDGFILPGHVSVIIGEEGYLPFIEKHEIPCVIAGFEHSDILGAVAELTEMIENGVSGLKNAYKRAVSFEGNPKAHSIMDMAFRKTSADWRGIGTIPDSGLTLNEKYAAFDAAKRFRIETVESETPKGCICGDILIGIRTPPDCPLFRKKCTPIEPVGPCMVSSEGACAAYYKYHQ